MIRQVLSNLPEITPLNEVGLTNIADMITKGKISIKPVTRFLTTTDGCKSLPNIQQGGKNLISLGEHGIQI